MAAVTVTAAKVGLVDPLKAKVKSYIAGAALTAGIAVYVDPTTGTVMKADGNAAGKYQFRGITLGAAAAGQAVDVCEEGELYGFTLSGNYDTIIYVGDTAGVLDTGAGTVTIAAGRVVPLADKSKTKVLHVFSRPSADWS